MEENEAKWDDLFTKIKVAIIEWREENPTATLTEIEEQVDRNLSGVRVQMIEDVALISELADLRGRWKGNRPKCVQCGGEIVANGRQERKIVTEYGKTIKLNRSKGYCSRCQVSFFPPG